MREYVDSKGLTEKNILLLEIVAWFSTIREISFLSDNTQNDFPFQA